MWKISCQINESVSKWGSLQILWKFSFYLYWVVVLTRLKHDTVLYSGIANRKGIVDIGIASFAKSDLVFCGVPLGWGEICSIDVRSVKSVCHWVDVRSVHWCEKARALTPTTYKASQYLKPSSNSTSAGPDSWLLTQVIQAVLEAGECDKHWKGMKVASKTRVSSTQNTKNSLKLRAVCTSKKQA